MPEETQSVSESHPAPRDTVPAPSIQVAPASTAPSQAQASPPPKPPAPDQAPKRKFPLIWIIALVIGITLLLGVLSWIFLKPTSEKQAFEVADQSQLYKGKISIGYVNWPGYIGLIVAQEKGFFKEEGLDVDVKPYPSLKEISEDYTQGKIQGRTNLTLEAIQEKVKGFDHQIILVIDYSNGSDGIIASPGITDISQIKGKKIAYEFGTLEDFFLTHSLTENSLTKKDIQGVNASPEDAAKLLTEKKVDVAVTYEPFMSQALKNTVGKKIYSSADAPGLITDILTFNEKFIEENPETISAVVRAYFKGVDFLQTNPKASHEILALKYETTPSDIKEQLSGVKVLSLEDNKVAFTFSAGTQSLYGNLRTINKFVTAQQESEEDSLDTDKLIQPRFIRNLEVEYLPDEANL